MAHPVKTETGIVACGTDQEVFEGLHLNCWQQIGLSVGMLASGEARVGQGALTMSEDVASTYVICRSQLSDLKDGLEACPEEVLQRGPNGPMSDVHALFEASLVLDDLYQNKTQHADDPRHLRFFSIISGYMEVCQKVWKSSTTIGAMDAYLWFETCVEKAEDKYRESLH
jgi:hypothetical protein